jgi:serine/threonine-protein kinase
MPNDAQHALIGCTLGNRYVVERVLGTGAMGTVYRARQTRLDTWVAIKVLHPRWATDPEIVQRFEREAFATSRLDHPNALRVLDFGADGDVFYLVTEYVDAEDLQTIMEAQWPLRDERIVAILSQVLCALTAVHEVGIVHRDLKPENILVLADKNDDGARVDVVKVCDFGIAKVARPTLPKSRPFAPRLTAAGVVVGTPDYMSPEQARGQAVDGRSDLYSLGVVLYHLLAGQTPFDADTPVGIAVQHVSDTPVPPSHYRAVHPGLEAVCLRALSKRPEDRFQTARDMRKALRGALAMDATSSALVPAPVMAMPLRAGPTFSSSSPAVLSLRPPRRSVARTRLGDSQLRRRRLSLGYAVLVSVATITASAYVSSRRSGTVESRESNARAEAAMALIGPPALAGARAASPPNEVTAAPDPAAPSDPVPPPPSPMETPKRVAGRARPQAATKPEPHHLVIAIAPRASPKSSDSPPAIDPVLIRRDPWPSPGDVPPTPAPATPVEVRAPAAFPPPSMRAERPAPRALATSRALVSFSNVVTSAGISGEKVKVSLSHVPLVSCYQQAVRLRPARPALETELRLTIDVGGRVASAALSRDGNLDGLRSCIEAAARGAQIRDVDTGDGSATVQLRFSSR